MSILKSMVEHSNLGSHWMSMGQWDRTNQLYPSRLSLKMEALPTMIYHNRS
jgi:hypothetical protein